MRQILAGVFSTLIKPHCKNRGWERKREGERRREGERKRREGRGEKERQTEREKERGEGRREGKRGEGTVVFIQCRTDALGKHVFMMDGTTSIIILSQQTQCVCVCVCV